MRINNSPAISFKGAVKIPSTDKARKIAADIAWRPSVKLVEIAESDKGNHLNLQFYDSDSEKKAIKKLTRQGIEFFHLHKPDMTPKQFDVFVEQPYPKI